MSLTLNKNGNIIHSNFQEYIVEPDGSVWRRIFYHNSPSPTNLFSNTTTNFTKYYYIDSNRFFDIAFCNKLSSWEFLSHIYPNDTSTMKTFRWTQPVNPMTATYAQVAPSLITKNTSGYDAIGTNFGGIYQKGTQTYIACHDTKGTDNWWGAFGIWQTHLDGAPVLNGLVLTETGFYDLYVRIDNTTKSQITSFAKDIVITDNIIEY